MLGFELKILDKLIAGTFFPLNISRKMYAIDPTIGKKIITHIHMV
jgi:hypothetical protein